MWTLRNVRFWTVTCGSVGHDELRIGNRKEQPVPLEPGCCCCCVPTPIES